MLKIIKATAFFLFLILLLAAPIVYVVNTVKGNSLEKIVIDAQKGTKGTYGIYIKHLMSGENYHDKENMLFDAGSFYKLWVMVAAYEQIKQDKLREDEELSADIATLNKKFDISEDAAEQTEGKITLTVSQAIFQMITISHNHAALLLTDRIGISKIAAVLKKYNLDNSSIGNPPKTTAYDMALFFEKLYNGEIINQTYSKKMLQILKQQKLNDGLPKYLLDDIGVAHKTAEIDFFKHDGGIVFTDKGDYIIVVLSESDNPAGAADRIANLSEAVYQYFHNR
ncbi:MAG: serine hydrolase [Candidatus Levybacteria bacterium]|nr:serine hydrolase [Candidatus Levybacteria bacterium]